MISEEDLPESLVSKCLDVLRQLSPSERDLIRVVVEVIHDLRDRTDEEDQAVNRPLGSISVKKTKFAIRKTVVQTTNRPSQRLPLQLRLSVLLLSPLRRCQRKREPEPTQWILGASVFVSECLNE